MLELFSVGSGNFSEADVLNASKALTGWTVNKDRFDFNNERHDDSNKVILGKRGKWNGDDAVRIAMEHPATAKRITTRVCDLLMGEKVVGEDQLQNLADNFSKRNMDLDWLLKTIISSNLFFNESNIGTRILGATEFIVGTIRALNAMTPPPSTMVVADWTKQLGQTLFYPPNVFGFAEGREWISSQWLISRVNFVKNLLEGKAHRKKFEFETAFESCFENAAEARNTDYLATLLLSVNDKETLAAVKDAAGDDLKKLVKMILTLPVANLG